MHLHSGARGEVGFCCSTLQIAVGRRRRSRIEGVDNTAREARAVVVAERSSRKWEAACDRDAAEPLICIGAAEYGVYVSIRGPSAVPTMHSIRRPTAYVRTFDPTSWMSKPANIVSPLCSPLLKQRASPLHRVLQLRRNAPGHALKPGQTTPMSRDGTERAHTAHPPICN